LSEPWVRVNEERTAEDAEPEPGWPSRVRLCGLDWASLSRVRVPVSFEGTEVLACPVGV